MPTTGLRQLARTITIAVAATLIGTGAAIPAQAGPDRKNPTKPVEDAPVTADVGNLHTWWHDNAVYNTDSPTENGEVRRSSFYDVQVAQAHQPDKFFDSFAYMSIPRSGKGKVGYTKEDGAEFSSEANLSMSWSSFEYAKDVWVDVSLKTGQTISSADEVQIRPSSYDFEKKLVDEDTIRIKVPYSDAGYRFSVEFDPQLYTSYNDMSGNSGKLTTVAEGNRPIHTEPMNSMMIFAEPKLQGEEEKRLIPNPSSGSIHYPEEGEVKDLNTVTEEIIYFKPGTYHMGSDYHAVLPPNVKWVYLAPGAYVKGAFRFFHDNQAQYKVTGYGVLSGEQYVYEADTANNYNALSGASNCHVTCVKMLQFESSNIGQQLDLQGVTINEPPYHSFVVYAHEGEKEIGVENFRMNVENYKQVGSWYWQTDGIELYQGGTMKNTFFNANDDVLKMYHSDVTIDNTVIWKNENGPVIQWGWTPRNIDNVNVTDTTVIHNRMYWKDPKYNTCILNSSSHWEDMGSTAKADPNTTVKNMRFENITVEGMTNCAMRIYALSNTENIHVKNLSIDSWNGLDWTSQVSHLKRYTNSAGEKVTIGNEIPDGNGLALENYSVGGEIIEKSGDNWNDYKLGRLGFDGENWDSWNAWKSTP
uniref:Isomaltotrio-dextranase precusor n=2 Tax=Brevibacterium fuscum var. dextranlyticum TaxID=90748 RepID=Q9WXI3_9MICO|nr:isomaltotrio-dextranase precusor [Brevibacterium fuscum var. dextranlyticum]